MEKKNSGTKRKNKEDPRRIKLISSISVNPVVLSKHINVYLRPFMVNECTWKSEPYTNS